MIHRAVPFIKIPILHSQKMRSVKLITLVIAFGYHLTVILIIKTRNPLIKSLKQLTKLKRIRIAFRDLRITTILKFRRIGVTRSTLLRQVT